MTKRSRNNSGTDRLPSSEGSLDATAVADLLDLAKDADLEQVASDVAEVKTDLVAVQGDVEELKEVVAAGGASGDPTVVTESPAASSSAGLGSVTPVLVNGQPATPEQARAAMETLRTGKGRFNF